MNKTFEGFRDDKKHLEYEILSMIGEFENHYNLSVGCIWLDHTDQIAVGRRTFQVKVGVEV